MRVCVTALVPEQQDERGVDASTGSTCNPVVRQ
jgi:hypothetical protein